MAAPALPMPTVLRQEEEMKPAGWLGCGLPLTEPSESPLIQFETRGLRFRVTIPGWWILQGFGDVSVVGAGLCTCKCVFWPP